MQGTLRLGRKHVLQERNKKGEFDNNRSV
ncbi:hypothetical protein HU200_050278 [Digitaria exilis]|uniref:Uncharacterized protein n=1 Tax=Digitaria exilis TaxID=1010633 RepID=A0A835E979_9POAL|nr:hypothetical protein HU200_050278 [Digitaria exilis]